MTGQSVKVTVSDATLGEEFVRSSVHGWEIEKVADGGLLEARTFETDHGPMTVCLYRGDVTPPETLQPEVLAEVEDVPELPASKRVLAPHAGEKLPRQARSGRVSPKPTLGDGRIIGCT